MGFFSSRKTDSSENDNYHVTAMIGGGSSGSGEKSVVKVLRSRFYGKKGKEREEPISYIPQSVSVAQTLSIETPAVARAPAVVTSSPLAGSSHSKPSNLKRVVPHAASSATSPTLSPSSTTSPSSLHGNPLSLPSSSSSTRNERSLPATPATPKKWTFGNHTLPPMDFVTTPPPMTPVSDRGGEGRLKVSTAAATLSTHSRMSSDGVTVTLAQRLNELAGANADGLLNDDEYRLLRQNLFERFSSTSEVPRESPIVPTVLPRSNPPSSVPGTPDKLVVRPLSNFQVELPRPSSSQSKYSITSGVANLFRRTSGIVQPKDVTDTSSVWSQQSTTSSRWGLGRILSRKSSNSSMQTTVSTRDKAEISPITPRRDRSGSMGRPETPHSVRRRLATPPSSFPSGMKQENRFPNSSSIYNVFDEEHLSTSADIRQEILAVEAEVKRLMDAFMGLEVTTLSKTQRSRGYSVATTRSDAGRTSNVGSIAESRWLKRPNMGDSDGGSVRSANSAATGPSMKPKSVHSSRFGLRAKAGNTASSGLSTTSSRPSSLRRKNSSSSVQSYGVGKAGIASPSATTAAAIPSVPALPSHVSSGLNGANNSSASLARSAHVMASVPEDDTHSATVTVATTAGRLDDDMVVDEGDELEEIRRRREEVQLRYGARLDYLRAKLKSAELHEKLMRK